MLCVALHSRPRMVLPASRLCPWSHCPTPCQLCCDTSSLCCGHAATSPVAVCRTVQSPCLLSCQPLTMTCVEPTSHQLLCCHAPIALGDVCRTASSPLPCVMPPLPVHDVNHQSPMCVSRSQCPCCVYHQLLSCELWLCQPVACCVVRKAQVCCDHPLPVLLCCVPIAHSWWPAANTHAMWRYPPPCRVVCCPSPMPMCCIAMPVLCVMVHITVPFVATVGCSPPRQQFPRKWAASLWSGLLHRGTSDSIVSERGRLSPRALAN